MTTLIVYLCSALLLASVLGWRFANTAVWKQVDLLYYPLGAFGVVLLFASTNAQRQIADLGLPADFSKAALAKLVNGRSSDSRSLDDMVFTQFLGGLRRLDLGLWMCRSEPSNPVCVSGIKLVPLALAFANDADRLMDVEPENRRLRTCEKVEGFLQELRAKNALSPLVAEELLVHYREGMKKKFGELQFDEIDAYLRSFQQRTDAKIEQLPQASKPARDAARQIDILKADTQYGIALLKSFRSCLMASRGAIWIKEKEGTEQTIRETEDKIKAIREQYRDEAPTLGFLRLWVWPYVIILALALKFAKAVSGLRPPKLPTIKEWPSRAAPLGLARNGRRMPLRALGFRGTTLPPGSRKLK